MTDELIRKIQNLLDKRITSEMKVVYLLVELRKLMDKEGYKDPLLRTFSNWVVHTSLEKRAEGSTLILTEFDHFVTELRNKRKKLTPAYHITLGTFRESLKRCFEHFGLKAKLLNNRDEWKTFGTHYCRIVSECPIIFTASDTKLKYIKRVELQGVSSGVVLKGWPMIHWRLTFKDGKTQNWGYRFM